MRIRSGFVSNSSSSSFIVMMHENLVDADSFMSYCIIMSDLTGTELDRPTFPDSSLTVAGAIKQVFTDRQPMTLKTRQMVFDTLEYGGVSFTCDTDILSYPILIDYENIDKLMYALQIPDASRDAFRKEWKDTFKYWNTMVLASVFENSPEIKFFEVHYCDNNGEAALEHGEHWRYIPAIRISHH